MTTWLVILTFLLAILALESLGQSINHVEKPGSCPPLLRVQICSRTCFSDLQCSSVGKCCPTDCGGTICTRPVTMKQPTQAKPGSCPPVESSRWICSSTCKDDTDCKGAKKCCKSRCGALTCQKPDVQSIINNDPLRVNPDVGVNDVNGNLNHVHSNYEYK